MTDIFQKILDERDKKWDRIDAETLRADSHTTEGLKALLTLHGGGCVAMLGFMQALLTKEKTAIFTAYKYYGENALLFFAIGLVIAALMPAARVLDAHHSIANLLGAKGHHLWARASYVLWGLSWLAFIIGLFYVGRGIDLALI
jgi:hypothetical protein